MVESWMIEEGDVDIVKRHLHQLTLNNPKKKDGMLTSETPILFVACFYIQFILAMARAD